MNKSVFLFIICCVASQWSFGQEGVITSGGEVISPLKVNADLPKFQRVDPTVLGKSPGSNFYFIMDTLSLPFLDDFSTSTLKNYDTLTYNQSLVFDSISFAFTVDGIPMSSFSCVADTTWSYLLTDSLIPTLISKSTLTQYQIVNYKDLNNPFVPTDTSYCWSPFEVYDTITQLSPDTIDSIGIIIDTLVNSIDTFRVYPPDTGLGGKALSYWIDEHTFINSRYPILPPTLGVATFDGLNEFGQPYNGYADPLGYGVGDYLTSKPIDLSYLITDSVYISFYYQPEGIGNDPQDEDSLVLEYYAPQKRTWDHAWSVPGRSLQPFRHVILHIAHNDYLQNGFQFRFKNYGTISGAFDHWHVDYVRIDKNRNDADSTIQDVAIISATRSVFQDYEAIPWKHYLADTTFTLVDKMEANMNNLDTVTNSTLYKYTIEHNDGIIDSFAVWPLGTNTAELAPQKDSLRKTDIDYFFNWSSEVDSAVFKITSWVAPDTVLDKNRNNDTLRYYQRFYNYYAYDDGTAEGSYGLNSAGAKLAYQFTTAITDTLRALDMYFVQSKYDQSEEFFYLTVWSSLNPETIIYQQQFQRPEYEDSLNEFHTYLLDKIVVISGTYYVGWVQESDEELGIGIDMNRDLDSKRFYNVSGTWLQSLLGGAIMIRPLFGDTVIIPLTVEEQEQEVLIESGTSFNVYPNPASDVIRIDLSSHTSATGVFNVSILDLYGREVVSEINAEGTVDIRHLSDGIYFVKVGVLGSGTYETKKIFVSH